MMKILLLDVHNLAHRAAHAYNTLWSGDLFTGLYHGFFTLLDNYVRAVRPTHVMLCSDPLQGKRSLRYDWFPNYKGNRKAVTDPQAEKMHRAIQSQIHEIKRVCQFLPVWWLEAEGIEADDLIAWMAVDRKIPGSQKIIVSTDRDLIQLVREDVSMYYPGQKTVAWITWHNWGNDIQQFIKANKNLPLAERWTPKSPQDWTEFRILLGDASDNLPGVRGIGEKGAVQLMKKHGSFAAYAEALRDKHRCSNREKHLRSEAGAAEYALMRRLVALPNYEITQEIERLGVADTMPGVLNRQAFHGWCAQHDLKQIRGMELLA